VQRLRVSANAGFIAFHVTLRIEGNHYAPLKSRCFGSYTLQAAPAAVHAEAESVAVTDWPQIVALYNRLVRIEPSPVVQRNRAVAIAMRDGPEPGLTHIDAVSEHGELANISRASLLYVQTASALRIAVARSRG
jgi:predicted RNA polymerase sigma factor